MDESETLVKDILNVEVGYKKFFVTALVAEVKKLTSLKDNQYESVLLKDHSGIVKVLNLNPELNLKKGLAYNLILDTKGNLYNPVCFVKEANEANLDLKMFEALNPEEDDQENIFKTEESVPHLVASELLLNLHRVEETEDAKNQKVKKISFKDQKQDLYILRIWPNNEDVYNLDWIVENSEKEVFFEYVELYKRQSSNVTFLKILPEYTKITIL